METKKYIYCKYCGKKTETKRLDRKFCSDKHRGAYSVQSKEYEILNKKSFMLDSLKRSGINKNEVVKWVVDINEAWSVLQEIADKIVIEGDTVTIFIKK